MLLQLNFYLLLTKGWGLEIMKCFPHVCWHVCVQVHVVTFLHQLVCLRECLWLKKKHVCKKIVLSLKNKMTAIADCVKTLIRSKI